MALESKKWMLLGKVLGGILVGAAVVGVFFIKWKPEVEEAAPLVRPIKSMVLGAASLEFSRTYPGRVRANQEVKLAFEVSGVITNLLVKAGSNVFSGQVLAELDARDFLDGKNAAQAELERARAQVERIRKARLLNAVSEQALSDAEAAYNVALSQLSIKAKALEDTRLRAPFDGIISDRFVEFFEGIQAKQPVFSLQSTNLVKVEVYLPESRIALIPRDPEKRRKHAGLFIAKFDYPGRQSDRQFPLMLNEYSTESDPETQTFRVTFTMELPEFMVLPGMTVTVYERAGQAIDTEDGAGFPIPLDAVPVDGQGQYYVWVLEPSSGGFHAVKRQDVTVGKMMGATDILVTGGLKKGQRIALAGASVLNEGQQVRLLEPKTK